MKAYIAVVKETGGVVGKIADFDIRQEADDHVARTGGFVAPYPGGGPAYWTANSDAKTLVFNSALKDSDILASSWAELRKKRNALLASSDWTQGSDTPLSDQAKAEWTVLRQSLRNLPATTGDPANPTWPEAPE